MLTRNKAEDIQNHQPTMTVVFAKPKVGHSH